VLGQLRRRNRNRISVGLYRKQFHTLFNMYHKQLHTRFLRYPANDFRRTSSFILIAANTAGAGLKLPCYFAASSTAVIIQHTLKLKTRQKTCSVTLWYCIKMKKASIMISSLLQSLNILVICDSSQNSKSFMQSEGDL